MAPPVCSGFHGLPKGPQRPSYHGAVPGSASTPQDPPTSPPHLTSPLPSACLTRGLGRGQGLQPVQLGLRANSVSLEQRGGKKRKHHTGAPRRCVSCKTWSNHTVLFSVLFWLKHPQNPGVQLFLHQFCADQAYHSCTGEKKTMFETKWGYYRIWTVCLKHCLLLYLFLFFCSFSRCSLKFTKEKRSNKAFNKAVQYRSDQSQRSRGKSLKNPFVYFLYKF